GGSGPGVVVEVRVVRLTTLARVDRGVTASACETRVARARRAVAVARARGERDAADLGNIGADPQLVDPEDGRHDGRISRRRGGKRWCGRVGGLGVVHAAVEDASYAIALFQALRPAAHAGSSTA